MSTEEASDRTGEASDRTEDERLRAVGLSILLGEHESSSTLTPAELRRAVELATDDVSRLLAPFGFVVRPIDEEPPVPVPVDIGTRPTILTAIFVLAVVVIVVMYVIASDAGLI